MDTQKSDLKDFWSKKMKDMDIKVRSGSSIVNVKPIFSYNSKCLIVASGPNVKVYNVQSCECIHDLRYHKTSVISLQENKDNCLQFFSCSKDGIVVRWEIVEGTLLKVYNLKVDVYSFYAPTNSKWFSIQIIPEKKDYRLYSHEVLKEGRLKGSGLLLKNVLPFQKTTAIGFQGSFVASVRDNALSIIKPDTKDFVRHFCGSCELKCVACHPKDFSVATGDNQGRVFVWSNIFNSKAPIRSLYHWHTLPVADLAFSTEGNYLYSGGGEACLVKWNLFSDDRFFLPRLGAPIVWVQDSPDSSCVSVSLEENSVQFIDPQRNIVGLIQGLTRGYFHGGPRQNILSTGLLFDPQTKSIVLNGKPGHLQFYSVFDDKHLFELDISAKNFISNERSQKNYNVDVSKAAIDEKGQWLATVEYWCNEDVSPMIWLKFWEFSLTTQKFIMNTNIYLPHNKEVNCILFRPYDASDAAPVAVTTSEDCRFKTWTLYDDSSFDGKQSWNCALMDYYREHLPTGDACYSEDGSVLAIAVKNIATLWTDNNTQLEAALFQENSERPIKQLRFGRYSCKHLLVCHDGTKISVWNVLSLSLVFTINVAVQTIATDITSDIMVVFAEDNDKKYQNLYLFKPDSPHPLFLKNNVSDSAIVSALFVPKTTKGSSSEVETNYYENSQLFFFSEDQRLFTMTDKHDDDFESNLKKIKMSRKLPMTPFGFLQAEQKSSGVREIEHQPLFLENKDSSKDSMDYPNPTYMDHYAICSKVLRSLLHPKPVEKEENTQDADVEKTTIQEKETDEAEKLKSKMEQIDLEDLMDTESSEKSKHFEIRITDFSFLREQVKFTRS